MAFRRLLLIALLLLALPAWALTPSGPITVSTSNAVIQGLQITNGSGDCVTITGNATNITIKESEIGPCTGRGINIVNGSNHKIYDNYIHTQFRPTVGFDTGTNILVGTGVSGTVIQGNVICFGESNITSYSNSGVTIHGNYLCNPVTNTGGGGANGGRGQQIHGPQGSSGITATNNFLYSCERAADGIPGTVCPSSPNYVMSAHQEDAINLYCSSNHLIQNNYVIGGSSASGTAMIVDADSAGSCTSSNIQFRNNIVHNTAHAGPTVVVGSGHVVDGNKVQLRCLGGWNCGNDNALSIFKNYPSNPCGTVQVTNNIASSTRPCDNIACPTCNDCRASAYFGSGSDTCTGLTQSGNTLDAAAEAILDPIETTNPPPKIPPVPKNCTAVSPYTTQTTPALCGAALTAAPTVTITTNCGGGVGGNCSVATTPLTTLTGNATDDVGIPVGGITWSCPTCTPTSGTASCTGCSPTGTSVTWSVGSIGLAIGPNVITVSATDTDPQSVTDTITVTLLATTLRIDAGGSGGTFSDGTYQADAFFTGGSTATTGTPIAGTTDDALYQSERFLNLGAGATMQYDLPLANGTYDITLKFAEQFWTAVGQRVFHVDLNGVRVLSNFDLFAQVGANFTAIDRTFTTTVVGNTLPILFTNVVDHAEIVGMVAVPTTVTLAPPLLRLVK